MATAAKVETSKDATAMERLWALACVLAQQQRVNEALKCLEVRLKGNCVRWLQACFGLNQSDDLTSHDLFSDCVQLVINAKDLPVQTQLHSQILLAELCAIVCTNEKKAEDQELYLRRVQRAEKCVNAVEAALEDDKAIEVNCVDLSCFSYVAGINTMWLYIVTCAENMATSFYQGQVPAH